MFPLSPSPWRKTRRSGSIAATQKTRPRTGKGTRPAHREHKSRYSRHHSLLNNAPRFGFGCWRHSAPGSAASERDEAAHRCCRPNLVRSQHEVHRSGRDRWAGWRVQLPRFCGGKQIYFSRHNYGGAEAALIEAQYFRDESFKAAGVGLHEPIRPTKKRERGQVLPVAETYDPRRNHSPCGGLLDGDDQRAKGATQDLSRHR